MDISKICQNKVAFLSLNTFRHVELDNSGQIWELLKYAKPLTMQNCRFLLLLLNTGDNTLFGAFSLVLST